MTMMMMTVIKMTMLMVVMIDVGDERDLEKDRG